uniref:Retroviral polymerase SH3-like domain-containing protein n=1 Tax=Fagus sylvatica TaxID=28930 RepID=A0A2N9J4K2_FAGSY
MAQNEIPVAVSPAHSRSIITLTTDQLEDIIAQALVWASNASSSSALSVLPDKFSSWLLDSACCNHMTPYPSFFSHTSSTRHAPTIHTANDFTMLLNLAIALSLITLVVLCRIPGRGRNLGPAIELGVCLRFPVFVFLATGVSAATSSSPSLSLWHSRLGHASSSRPHEHNKLEPRSRLCCFLGYGETQKGYRCYDPIAHRLCISRHVVFWEYRLFTEVSQFGPSFSLSDLFPDVSTPSPELFSPSPEVSTSISQTESSDYSSESSSDVTPHSSPESQAPTPSEDPAPATTLRHSFRVTSLPSHLRDFHCYTALTTLHEPHSYREASSNPLWQATMTKELDALSRNRT